MADSAESAKPKERRVVKGPRTRALIRDAVLVLHERKPWNAITLTDICEATGLTVGAFYYHFESKDQVGEELALVYLQTNYKKILEEIETEQDIFYLYYLIISAFYKSYVNNPSHCRLAYLVLRAKVSVYDAWLEIRKPLLNRMETALVAARRERGLVDGSEVFVSQWLLNSIEDFLWSVFMGRSSAELGPVAAGPDAFVRQQSVLWYRAALAEEPQHSLARRAGRSGRRGDDAAFALSQVDN